MKLLRHLSTALATALLFAGAARAAPAPTPSPTPTAHRQMTLSADRISFYYDRFLLEADGNVRITTGDGLAVTGSTLTMDLKNNRFMVAGKVHLDSANGTQDGAALADFMDFNRVYFVPITSEPDRWTFENGDYTHPIKGREMPGDTFQFPDLSKNIPYLLARKAVIGEKEYVRFSGVNLMIGRMVGEPLPTYYISYSSDPHLAENSLAGANYDATWQVAGNRNFITAIHFRFDQTNKLYASIEQHFASKNAYAVFSINPLSRPSKFYNLVTDYQAGSNTEMHSFTEFHTLQNGFTTPAQEQHVTSIRLTHAFPQFSASLTYQTVNYCLLGTRDKAIVPDLGIPVTQACGSGPSLVGEPLSISHPQTWSLDVSSFEFPEKRSPFKLRVRAGINYIHDNCTNNDSVTDVCLSGLQVLNGAVYTTIGGKYLGATLYMPSLKIGDKEDPRRTYFFNALLDGQQSWFSVPHNVVLINGIASISRQFDRSLATYLSYEVRQTTDHYNKASDADVLYPPNQVYQDPNFSSFQAFRGSGTQRTLTFGLNYTPNPDFAFTLIARKHRDFPIPEPGLFALPPVNVLGAYTSQDFIGQPPYDLTGDLRMRVLRHYYLDISRTYYFNFGALKWSPSFVIQVSQ
ncbi:MAG: hypothetical protein M3R30_08780 [Candidatus Eremiobacteraeota bacterium]|nr:hypothetical protein [Candidatus Eremiobacteraeota bacterium]